MDTNFSVSSGAVSDRGLSEKRPQNEDSYLDMPQSGIYAVADGVGGAQAGDVASQMAVEILGEAFTNLTDADDAESVMRAAIERANSAIHQMALELPQLASMATTVVALHLKGNIATIGHVGDSRLYRVDRDGNLFRETDDHSMVAEEVRAGRMTQEQAETHPSRNIISRALGAESTVDVELKTIMVEPGTGFLICSDGITRHVADPEIQGVLTFGGQPGEICEYLKGLCYERGAEDNLTAVVIKLSTETAGNNYPAPISFPESEENTVASARSYFDSDSSAEENDELLELETRDLKIPISSIRPETERSSAPPENADIAASPQEDDVPRSEPVLAPQPIKTEKSFPNESLSMFNESKTEDVNAHKPSSVGRAATAITMLLLGSAIGLGVYRYALLPPASDSGAPNLSVMKSEDIAFSSFEKNRRNVDADPAAYLRELPPPEGAEDFYLIGRANMLVGDFAKARLAFIEAQKLIEFAEPANAKILKTDIATALMIANDPTLHARFKAEFDANTALPLDNSNVNR